MYFLEGKRTFKYKLVNDGEGIKFFSVGTLEISIKK